MSESNKTTENRRKLLKSLAAGGGAVIAGKSLPEGWSRPVVDSVLLPAHAQTSLRVFAGTQLAALETDSLFAKAFNSLVSQAHASYAYSTSWCITQTGPDTADVLYLVYDNINPTPSWAWLYYANGVTADGNPHPIEHDSACNGVTDASDWLNEMGLVRNAKAFPGDSVTLGGLNPGDSVTFVTSEGTVNSTLSEGPCGPTSVECTPT